MGRKTVFWSILWVSNYLRLRIPELDILLLFHQVIKTYVAKAVV